MMGFAHSLDASTCCTKHFRTTGIGRRRRFWGFNECNMSGYMSSFLIFFFYFLSAPLFFTKGNLPPILFF